MILVVDHYDSFTYNLVQLIESLGHETQVVKSDAEPAGALVERDAGRRDPVARAGPARSRRVLHRAARGAARPRRRCSASASATRRSASSTAARSTAPSPCTARPRRCIHDGSGIFEGVHDPFEAGRYHSLVVERADLPDDLELTAWTDDGLVMGTRHRELPRFGVQFHPESILTPEGPTIVGNFLALAR